MKPKQLIHSVSSYKTAFFASLLLIGIFAVYNWTVLPHRNYLKAAQKYEETLNALDKKKQILTNNVKTNKIKLKKLQDQFADIQGILFDILESREFFSNIEVVCAQSGCKMYSLTFSPATVSENESIDVPESDKLIYARSVKLTVLGRYVNITELMDKLQSSEKLVEISSVNISSDKQNQGYLKCNMTITIYVTNEKKESYYDQYE